ncbi:MAG: (E)-4-hydroxy-3-methylbut-2-enyl-diphosphate synthase [Bdellovibrionales bacterium]|nr:(E)-4-hydroxy-3-methylbut-2-enyl-diphosphate synthase [Bdellovibrionales bacterium]
MKYNDKRTTDIRTTREVRIGTLRIGSGHPIAVQSMCATRTQDIPETLKQIQLLESHGADLIRIAIDSKKDVDALREIRKETTARLVVDLQESYRLVEQVAPCVDKIRYNPGHLHHHQKSVSVSDKVKFIVDHAGAENCAVRIGVNFGSLDPSQKEHCDDPLEAAIQSAEEHLEIMETLQFDQFVVSLKSSDPNRVVEINRRFHDRHPLVPIHLGVTEAGMLPMGEIKTRVAFENLIPFGVGDTIRVSLTLPFDEKFREITVGKAIIQDIANGRYRSVPQFEQQGLNIISCPSCSRVENTAFIELAAKVREVTQFAADRNITIAVMGCRVNGPGETDHADLGLWCAPNHVNLKKRSELLGTFSYDEIVPRLLEEVKSLIGQESSLSSQ